MEDPMLKLLRELGAQLAPHLAAIETPGARLRLEVTADKASLELFVDERSLQRVEVAL